MADEINPFPKDGDQKELFWKQFDSQRWGFLRWGISVVRGALDKQAEHITNVIDRTGSVSAGQGALESIPKKPMEDAFIQIYSKVGGAFAMQIYQSFKSHAPSMQTKQDESLFMRFLREWIQVNGALRIQAITRTTRKRISVLLEQAIAYGLGAEEAARLIAENSRAVGLQRARVIARTEIISASNRGSMEGARRTNLNLEKEWLSSRDGRTRRIPEDKTDHFTIDGQTRALDEPFEVPHLERGVEFLMFPGDPSGSPEAVIQCRCTQAYRKR